MASWILILVSDQTPLLLLFVAMLQLLGQPSQAGSRNLSVMCPSCLDYFLTSETSCFRLIFAFLPRLEFLHGAWIPFHGEWHLETKIRTLGMLTAAITSSVTTSRP